MEFEDQFPWPCRPIGDMLETNIDYRGKTPPKSETGIPTLTAGNVKDGKIDMTKVSYVSQETYEEWTTRGFPEPGDVLITLEAPVGEVASFPGDQTYLITRRIIALRGKKDELDNDFLKYSLLCPFNRDRLLTLSRGTTVERILKTDLTDLKIPAPPIEEQRAIASILGALDDKIELNRRMNATLESLARAIFKSWFVDFDPVKINAGQMPASSQALATHDPNVLDLFPSTFQDSELGPIPEGWSVERADQVYDVAIGKTPPRKQKQWFTTNRNDVRWMSIKDMGASGIFISETSERLTEAAVEKFNVRRIPDRTVVLSFKLTVGRVAITDGEMLSNEAIAHFKTNEKSIDSPEYLYCYLREFDYGSLGSTSSIATVVNSKTIKAMPILVPTESVIAMFNESVGALFQQIRKTDAESRQLCRLRDTLLPQLLSGDLPVPAALTRAEEALA